MKTCFSCGNILSDEAAYCYLCNTSQTQGFEEFEPKPVYSDTFLKILCILTIIGAFLGLIGVAINWSAMSVNSELSVRITTLIALIIAVGKFTGAVLMLQKKLNGLYIYTGAAILSMGQAIYSFNVIIETEDIYMISGGVIAFLFLIVFLIMYWLPDNRRLLS